MSLDEVCRDDSGESVKDQASPFRKSMFFVAAPIEKLCDDDAAESSARTGLGNGPDNLWLLASREDCSASSHWVSQFWDAKSGCDIMARSMSRFVFTPSICVSSRALRAFCMQDA